MTTYTPTLDAFRALARGPANLIPVTREFAADLETPVSVYLKLMEEPGASFLLESVEGGEQVGRYSFVGVGIHRRIELHGDVITHAEGNANLEVRAAQEREPGGSRSGDILDALRAELGRYRAAAMPGLPRLSGGAVGYFGYDVVRFFERLPQTAAPLGTGGSETRPYPDALFLLVDTVVVFDHARHRLILLANAHVEEGGDVEAAYVDALQRIDRLAEKLLRPLPAVPSRRWGATHGNGLATRSNVTVERYEAMVRQAKEHIAAGDIFQVVLSQRFSRRTSAHPFAVYRALRLSLIHISEPTRPY